MSQRVRMALALILGIAMGAGAVWFAGRGAVESRPVPTATGQSTAGAAAEIAAREPGLEREIPLPGAGKSPQRSRDLEGEASDEPEILPSAVEYPRLEKLASRPLSEVPHRVLGAWDEDHASSSPGQRRAFVLVVEPGLSEAELEALARDVRDQNRDAVILDVSIYDSERAALQARAPDGGALAFQHLVAEVRKNDRIPLDVIRVRGRRIEP